MVNTNASTRPSEIVFLNGRFVSGEEAVVSVFDRGFLYGDGVFETLLVRRGKPFRWAQHMTRLQQGLEFLGFRSLVDYQQLRDALDWLVKANQMPEALARLTISRGRGPRGYSAKSTHSPTVILALHPAPDLSARDPARWQLVSSSVRLASQDRLAQFKTCNKLPQILARAEAEAAGGDEALLINTDGYVAEASAGNVFWSDGGRVGTPPLAGGILPGVTRAVIFELCRQLSIAACEESISAQALRHKDGVFLSMSSAGIVEVTSLDGIPIGTSPLTAQLHRAYGALLDKETGDEG